MSNFRPFKVTAIKTQGRNNSIFDAPTNTKYMMTSSNGKKNPRYWPFVRHCNENGTIGKMPTNRKMAILPKPGTYL